MSVTHNGEYKLMEDGNRMWEVHFADGVPRWRVVSFSKGAIVMERQFNDYEEACEYLNTLDQIVMHENT